jgi:signal transduction histidine kinase
MSSLPFVDDFIHRSMSQLPEQDKETARLLMAGRLVRAVAHDLRQPLMALEMNLATILKLTKRETLDPGQIADAIEDARLAGRRMAASLQALEDLAVPRRRRHEPMDVGAMVREIVTLVSSNVKTSHVRIDGRVAPSLPQLIGDPSMVREAILSLTLSAADQATAPLALQFDAAARPQAQVMIEARAEDADHIAIVVNRGSTPWKHVADTDEEAWATAIARAVIALHRGSLTIETDSLGSRATMRWPIGDTIA